MPAADAGADVPDTDDSPLLAVPPGSRNSPRLTPGAKGKVYYPKQVDKRPAGARTRHLTSIGSTEITPRTTVPGRDSLAALGRGVVESSTTKGNYVAEEPIYSQMGLNEELQIFEVNDSVRHLVETLDEKDKLLTEQNDEK